MPSMRKEIEFEKEIEFDEFAIKHDASLRRERQSEARGGAKPPPHPLVMDRETKLFRYVAHDDIVRWERMEIRYENLLTTLRQAIGDGVSNEQDATIALICLYAW